MTRAFSRGVPHLTPVVVIALALLVLYLLWHILVVFVIAAFLAFLLRPVVELFGRALPRVLAILVVFLLLAAILGTAGRVIFPLVAEQFEQFLESIPSLIAGGRDLFNDIQRRYIALPSGWQDFVDQGLQQIQTAAVSLTRQAIPAVMQFVSLVAALVLVPVLTFFMLLGYDGYGRMLLAVTPRNARPSIVGLGRRLDGALWAYVRGQSLLMLVVGLATGTGLALVGMPYPIVFGIMAGFLEIIPNFGPTVTFLTVTLVALIFSPFLALKAGLVALTVQLLENSLIAPVVLAKAVDIDPVTVALAVLVGGTLGGGLGVLASIPLAVMIKVTLLYFYAQDSDLVPAAKRCRNHVPAAELDDG